MSGAMGMNSRNLRPKTGRVLDILLEAADSVYDPWMPFDGSYADMKDANKFVLCVMALEIGLDEAEEYTRDLAEDALRDPDDLWGKVLENQRAVRSLLPGDDPRRSDAIAARIIKTAGQIGSRYGGDARRIWGDGDDKKTFERLHDIADSRAIAEDIVKVLYKTKQLKEWPWMPTDGRRASKKEANKFFVGAMMDYQMKAWLVWNNAKRLSEGILGDPDDLWKAIRDKSEEGMKDLFRAELLHRFPDCGIRLWRAADRIGRDCGGDVRMMWEGKTTDEAREEFLKLYGIGRQLASMIVGALIDTGQIEGRGDLKADTNVRRVLGRVFEGDMVSPDAALGLADQMLPGDSWQIDNPLFNIGRACCRKRDPLCSECPLQQECAYAGRSLTGPR